MATIHPNPNFNAGAAASSLRAAMKGLGTDEETIIQALVAHSNAQRQEIKAQYKNMFGRDLVEDLKSELGGKLEDAILALMDVLPLYLAKGLRTAIQGAGTDEAVLIEILCPRLNNEIRSIKAHYEHEFKRKLEDDIKSDVGGDFESLLVSLCQANRDESAAVDQAKAQADAQALIEAGIKQIGTDESVFNNILCTRSFPQLRATFEKYKAISGKGIIESIKSEMSGSLEEGFCSLAQFVLDSNAYFAERLYKSMAGGGTDDPALVRLIVSRSEFDLKTVSQKFNKLYGKTLRDFISGDCGGDYCRLLLAVLGNN